MKLLIYFIMILVTVFSVGWFLTPFVVAIWFIATHSLFEIIKWFLIIYVAMIPVAAFVSARKG